MPPEIPIGEADRAISGYALAGLFQSPELIGQTTRRRMIVIVPVRDDLARCLFAAEVALVADSGLPLEMDQPDSRVVRNEVPYVRAVRQDEQLRVAAGLLPEETRNRLRQPLSPVSRQTQARDEKAAARSPGELPAR